jgi:hypothetical protein
MVALLLLLLLIAILFGVGFTAHLLWVAAVVLLIVWLIGFVACGHQHAPPGVGHCAMRRAAITLMTWMQNSNESIVSKLVAAISVADRRPQPAVVAPRIDVATGNAAPSKPARLPSSEVGHVARTHARVEAEGWTSSSSG